MNEIATDPEQKGMCDQKNLCPSCPVPHSICDSVNGNTCWQAASKEARHHGRLLKLQSVLFTHCLNEFEPSLGHIPWLRIFSPHIYSIGKIGIISRKSLNCKPSFVLDC